jgi:phenylpropionate dioxygenase-like ring-hydroxylating dioxygenase large terminal subunit
MADGEIRTRAGGEAARAVFGRGFLHDLWYFVELGSALKPGAMRRYEVLGEPVLVGRDRRGEPFALRDICPHRAAPLSAGWIVDGEAGGAEVACPYHGWRFRTGDGACAAIPSLADGQEMQTERIRVRRYPVAESQGLLFVYMAADPRAETLAEPAPPVFPGVRGKPKVVERMDFDSHLDHAIVGLMDPAHGPYVHQQWWWRSAKKQLEKTKRFEPRELGFAMVRHAPSKNSRAYRLLGGAPETEITFRLPGLRWEHVQVGAKSVLALTCLTPVHETKTRITQLIWSDHPAFDLLRPLIRAGARRFLHQDGDMVNLQNEGLRYDPTLLWIDDADRQAKWYQALKREWAAARAEGRPFANPVQPAVLRWRS